MYTWTVTPLFDGRRKLGTVRAERAYIAYLLAVVRWGRGLQVYSLEAPPPPLLETVEPVELMNL